MTNPNNQTPSQALQKRLEILAGMISMGEKIAWGSDSALMLEAAAMLAAKDAELADKRVQVNRLLPYVDAFRREETRADLAERDTDRLDWVLSFAGGDDSPLADKRTMQLAKALMTGLDGRAAVDAAMVC